jgi:hypothetical protein
MTIKRLTKADHPVSFGAFKPVGHVIVALPDEDRAKAATAALLAAGFEEDDVLHYSADEEDSEMARLLDRASDLAGFGYEVTLMRRYRELAHEGCSWLLVYAPDEAHAARVAAVARRFDARLAEKYHRLVVEDLI